MDCQEISKVINELKVNSIGVIRGKRKVIDKVHSMHLKNVDSDLMDVRVFVARLSTGLTTTEALKQIDAFIYKKQIS